MKRVRSALPWLCPSAFDGLCEGLLDLSSGISTLTLLYGWISALSLKFIPACQPASRSGRNERTKDNVI